MCLCTHKFSLSLSLSLSLCLCLSLSLSLSPSCSQGSRSAAPSDYASKHWSGLIKDYYAARVQLHQKQALADAAKGQPLDRTAIAAIEALHAYTWTTATNKYPTSPVGDALAVSVAMQSKYKAYFTGC